MGDVLRAAVELALRTTRGQGGSLADADLRCDDCAVRWAATWQTTCWRCGEKGKTTRTTP